MEKRWVQLVFIVCVGIGAFSLAWYLREWLEFW